MWVIITEANELGFSALPLDNVKHCERWRALFFCTRDSSVLFTYGQFLIESWKKKPTAIYQVER